MTTVNKKILHIVNGEFFAGAEKVQHIIGTHSKEGDLGKRTVESIIVHHADFVSFEPFKV